MEYPTECEVAIFVGELKPLFIHQILNDIPGIYSVEITGCIYSTQEKKFGADKILIDVLGPMSVATIENFKKIAKEHGQIAIYNYLSTPHTQKHSIMWNFISSTDTGKKFTTSGYITD